MMKVNLHDFGVDFLCLSFWDDDDIDHLVGFYFLPLSLQHGDPSAALLAESTPTWWTCLMTNDDP